MLLEELFEQYDVECPEWLKDIFLDDDWEESQYSKEDNTHKWTLKNPFKDVAITFDGTEYHLLAYDEEGELLFDNVTTEEYGINH